MELVYVIVPLAALSLLFWAAMSTDLVEEDEVEIQPSEEELYESREEHFRQYVLGMAERED